MLWAILYHLYSLKTVKNTYFSRFLNYTNGTKSHKASHINVFYKRRFSSNQPQCCLTFSWIELQMLLRSCLTHITIIIPRHILYLIYLCPCLDLDLFKSYLCNLFFNFRLIFIVVNHVISLKQTHLLFANFPEYFLFFLDDNVDEENQ